MSDFTIYLVLAILVGIFAVGILLQVSGFAGMILDLFRYNDRDDDR